MKSTILQNYYNSLTMDDNPVEEDDSIYVPSKEERLQNKLRKIDHDCDKAKNKVCGNTLAYIYVNSLPFDDEYKQNHDIELRNDIADYIGIKNDGHPLAYIRSCKESSLIKKIDSKLEQIDYIFKDSINIFEADDKGEENIPDDKSTNNETEDKEAEKKAEKKAEKEADDAAIDQIIDELKNDKDIDKLNEKIKEVVAKKIKEELDKTVDELSVTQNLDNELKSEIDNKAPVDNDNQSTEEQPPEDIQNMPKQESSLFHKTLCKLYKEYSEDVINQKPNFEQFQGLLGLTTRLYTLEMIDNILHQGIYRNKTLREFVESTEPIINILPYMEANDPDPIDVYNEALDTMKKNNIHKYSKSSKMIFDKKKLDDMINEGTNFSISNNNNLILFGGVKYEKDYMSLYERAAIKVKKALSSDLDMSNISITPTIINESCAIVASIKPNSKIKLNVQKKIFKVQPEVVESNQNPALGLFIAHTLFPKVFENSKSIIEKNIWEPINSIEVYIKRDNEIGVALITDSFKYGMTFSDFTENGCIVKNTGNYKSSFESAYVSNKKLNNKFLLYTRSKVAQIFRDL